MGNVAQEERVLTSEQVNRIYQPGVKLKDYQGEDKLWLPHQTAALDKLGFHIHTPKPNQRRIFYEMKEEDVKSLKEQLGPELFFTTKFGTVQHIKAGVFLAMHWPKEGKRPDKALSIYVAHRA